MSLEYAIRKMTLRQAYAVEMKTGRMNNISPDKWDRHSAYYFDIEYNIVSRDVAESHPLGAARIMDVNGIAASGWMPITYEPDLAKQIAGIKMGSGKAFTDSRGYPLQAGDYIYTTYTEGGDIYLGKVLAFTPKSIKIALFPNINCDSYLDVGLKISNYTVKVGNAIADDDDIHELFNLPKQELLVR